MKLKDSIIIILAVVIAIVVGVFVGFKLSESKNDNPTTNNGTTNNNNVNNNENTNNENVNKENTNNGDAETEKDFSLVEAEKLMSKYSYSDFCNQLYIEDLTNDNLKRELAINSTEKSGGYSCSSVYGRDFGDEGYYYNDAYACIEDDAMGTTSFYKYNDILESKKLLFGKVEMLTKKTFDSASGIKRYEYNSKNNIYVGLQLMGGGYCAPNIKNNVESAKVLNDTLKIVIIKKEYNLDKETQEMTTVKSEKKIQYVFKKQNSNYYLAEIKKLSTSVENNDSTDNKVEKYEKKDYDLKDNLKSKNISFIENPLNHETIIFDGSSNANGDFTYASKNINVIKTETEVFLKSIDGKEVSFKYNYAPEVHIIESYLVAVIPSAKSYSIKIYNKNLENILSADLDQMAEILLSGNYLYYGIGKCEGIKPNGKTGNIVEVHRFNLNTGVDEIVFNLDHISGWTC